jgi:hypothetical protein
VIDPAALQMVLGVLTGWLDRWERVRAPRHRDHLFHAIVITHSTAS